MEPATYLAVPVPSSTLYIVRTQSGQYIFIGTIGTMSISTPEPLPQDLAVTYAGQLRELIVQMQTRVEISNCSASDPVVKILRSNNN